MAVTSKNLRSAQAVQPPAQMLSQRLYTVAYGVMLLLAALAIYVLVGVLISQVRVTVDDLRYGRPRTTHIDGFVGHGEAAGRPTHLIALNLDRQVVILELPGGDATSPRTITGPYLFGASEDLTPVTLQLQDVDGDGLRDLVLDIRSEQVIYLNKDGTFRLPAREEQALLNQRGSP